jgi:hypothetical protein
VAVGAPVRIRPLPYDKLPIPPQNRFWCHDGGDLTQHLPSQPVSPDRQASPVGIGELGAPLTQLTSKDAVILHLIRWRLGRS